MTDLRMDLVSGEIFINVDFFRDNSFIFRKEYYVGKSGDVDVNELIDNLHLELNEKI